MTSTERLRHIAVLFAVLISVLLVLGLGFEVVRKINALATANSDNVQWNLSQAEVEQYALVIALRSAQAAQDPDLDNVRRRFDVFYSRIKTLESSDVYRTLRHRSDFFDPLQRINAFLDSTVDIVDSSDELLLRNLARLADAANALSSDVRALSLEGIKIFSAQSDARRKAVATTLTIVATVTLALLLVLLMLVVVLSHLYRQGKKRSTTVQMTTSRLHAIATTSLDAIVVVNRDGLVVDYNGAAETIFGYTQDEAIGQTMSDLIVPHHMHDAHEAGMQRYRETGEKRVIGKGRLELEARRKNGEVFPVELSINTAESEEGEIFVSFLRDISAQKAAELALTQARDDALAGEKAKADLLAVMSHEMRTPLNGLLGTMDNLKHTKLSEKQQEYLRIMEMSGRHLLHHVNDVLDVSRLDSGKLQFEKRPFDLNFLVRQVVESMQSSAEANGNHLRVAHISTDVRFVTGDENRLRQILLNLVGNALKFTRDGEISIDVDRTGDQGLVEFRVCDTGGGIPESELERVFDDFVTVDASYGREAEGTGLGLAITRRLVQALGGTIGVESELGEGSLFWFRLPLATCEEPAKSNHEAISEHELDSTVPNMDASRKRILLVEDNEINRLVATDMLESLGHTVTEACDGEEGVKLAADITFDVILMDISMPRMDGVQATKAIRDSGKSKDTKIIALTAHALPTEIRDFKEAGMDDVLIKPISRVSLNSALAGEASPADSRQTEYTLIDRKFGQLIDLEEISTMIEAVGSDVAVGHIRAFIEETDAVLDEISRISPTGTELREMAHRIHQLAGSAAMLGALQMHSHFSLIERCAKEGKQKEFAEAKEPAFACWLPTRKALRQTIRSNAENSSDSLEAV